MRSKIKIICPIHGEFEQNSKDHLKGSGCKECSKIKQSKIMSKNITTFINNAILIHGDKYDYSLAEYINNKSRVKIICPEHGEFVQTPDHHINQKQGCPICKESKGEKIINNFLVSKNIIFIRQYRFNDCRNIRPLPFDFYLPEHNICIEYDGEQHSRKRDSFGVKNNYLNIKKHDLIKTKYCLDNSIKLIRINYLNKLNEIYLIKTILSEININI